MMSADRLLNIVAFVVTISALLLSTRMLLLEWKRVRREVPARWSLDFKMVGSPTLRRTALFAMVSLLASLATASLIVSNPQRPSQAALDSLRAQRAADSIKSQVQAIRRRMANDSLNLAINLARSGHLRAALVKYDASLALDSTNSVTYNLKGYTLLKLGRAKEAVEVMKRGTEIDSNSTWGYYNLALAYWAVGDTVAAVNSIVRLLKLAPDFRETIRADPQFRKLSALPAFKRVLGESP